MKLIATRNFARVPALDGLEIKSPLHPKLIHKGAVFEIGEAPDFDQLTKHEKWMVAQLNLAKCIADAGNPVLVKEVQDEVEAERRSEANAAKANAKLNSALLSNQLGDVLGRLLAQAH